MTGALSTPQPYADAWDAAAAVARRGAFVVREVGEPAEHRAVERLLREIWSTREATPPMPGDILRMLSYTGAYVAGAFAGSELIGAAVGFLTDTRAGGGGAHLHSHIAGVAVGHRGRDVGFGLKLHQRAWALERGFDRISWTFDPLVRRNAYFNLTKLGARATNYLIDFYGEMPDGLNAGQGSDRILVDWPLRAPSVERATRGIADATDIGPADVILRFGPDQHPQLLPVRGTAAMVCEIPADIEQLREADPALGREWRQAVRAVLYPALGKERRIAHFDRRLGYVIRTGPRSERRGDPPVDVHAASRPDAPDQEAAR